MNTTATSSHASSAPRLARPVRSNPFPWINRLHGAAHTQHATPSTDVRRARPVAISRRGIDHGWIGILLFLVTFAVVGRGTAAADAMDQWTPVTVGDSVMKTPTDLMYANGEFWAVGTQARVQHSADRQNWYVVQTPALGTLESIAYGNGRYVAVGDKLTIMSSPNGTDWTVHLETPAATQRYKQVIFADGKFVAVGGRGLAAWSTNGTDWTPVTMNNVDMYCSGVTWGNGLFVASGEMDGYYCIATSPDGATWTRRYVNVGWGYKAVAYFNGLFIAGAVSELATSPDGITWTRLTVSFQYSNMTIQGIKVLNGRVFAFGNYGLVMSSTNGTDWVPHTTGTTYNIVALDYDNDRLLLFRSGIVSSGNGPAASDPWSPVGGGGGDGGGGDGSGDGEDSASSIANISTRAWIGTGDSQLVSGFVIQGTTSKKVLIRAVGPTLETFGLTGVLTDPQVRLLNSSGTEIAANNDWGTLANQNELAQTTTAVGAFALTAGSKDAVLLVTLQPGLYTTQVFGAANGTGIALVEVYDTEVGNGSRLINISSRGYVGTGVNVAIPGFVVTGTGPRTLLIRGVGPTLGGYGVSNVVADPTIALLNSSQATVAENNNWGAFADQAALASATSAVGAFALTSGGADAALLVTVQPGAYTVVVSGVNGGVGNTLVEVYEVP